MRRLSSALTESLAESGAIDHAGVKGTMREADVRDGLRPYIPGRYDLGEGIVINVAGEQSEQQDVVIADSIDATRFITKGGLGYYPIESVAGVVEVKSWADTGSVADAVKRVASVKSLLDESDRPASVIDDERGWISGTTNEKPFGGVLCLQTRGSREAIFESYADACLALPAGDRPNVFAVLNEFAVVWLADAEQPVPAMAWSPRDARFVGRRDVGANALLFFYVILMETLYRYVAPRLNLIDYTNAAAGTGTHVVDILELLPDQVDPTRH